MTVIRGDVVLIKREREYSVRADRRDPWSVAAGLSDGGYRTVMRPYWVLAKAALTDSEQLRVLRIVEQGRSGASPVLPGDEVYVLDASLREGASRLFDTLIASDEFATDEDLRAAILRATQPRPPGQRSRVFRWGKD